MIESAIYRTVQLVILAIGISYLQALSLLPLLTNLQRGLP